MMNGWSGNRCADALEEMDRSGATRGDDHAQADAQAHGCVSANDACMRTTAPGAEHRVRKRSGSRGVIPGHGHQYRDVRILGAGGLTHEHLMPFGHQ